MSESLTAHTTPWKEEEESCTRWLVGTDERSVEQTPRPHLLVVTSESEFRSCNDLRVAEGRGRSNFRAERTGSVMTPASSVSKTGNDFGEYTKDKSSLEASATSSFSSKPFVLPRLQRSELCFTNASLNFLIWKQNFQEEQWAYETWLKTAARSDYYLTFLR